MSRYYEESEIMKALGSNLVGTYYGLVLDVNMDEFLDGVPTADVPQWIPCNEEQPTCDGNYLVTLDFEWGKEIEMGEWFCGEWINPNSHVTVAWMPLPNPWKGKVDERFNQ